MFREHTQTSWQNRTEKNLQNSPHQREKSSREQGKTTNWKTHKRTSNHSSILSVSSSLLVPANDNTTDIHISAHHDGSHVSNTSWVDRTNARLHIWNFFSPVFLEWWGHVFGSVNFENFWPHIGFPPELFFQKSSIFSNKSHRVGLVVRLSAERSVYRNV